MYNLAKRYLTTEDELLRLNPTLKDGLKLNQEIVVPNAKVKGVKFQPVKSADEITAKESFYWRIAPWLICLLGAMFYSYEYFLRIAPSVAEQALRQKYQLDASGFGNLIYYYYRNYHLDGFYVPR